MDRPMHRETNFHDIYDFARWYSWAKTDPKVTILEVIHQENGRVLTTYLLDPGSYHDDMKAVHNLSEDELNEIIDSFIQVIGGEK